MTTGAETIDAVYRRESCRVFATLVRLLGDFDLAEEALQDAFAAAVERWGRDSVPANPRTWLVSAGRFKANDALGRRARFDASLAKLAEQIETGAPDPAARAFLASAQTIAQRMVRAQAKIRDARIPYRVPTRTDLPERLDAVLRVLYRVFNEGYSAPSAAATDWTRIVALYDALLAVSPSPVVELNQAVAIAVRDEPDAGLAGIDAILARGDLVDYHLSHAARGGRRGGGQCESWSL